MSTPFILQNKKGQSFDVHPKSLEHLDFIQINDQEWHVLEGGQSYNIQLIQFDYSNRQMQISVNGELFDLTIQDRYAQLIERMGLSTEVKVEVKDIKAPMPGLVLKTFVKEGETFVKGDSLLILEAMKMENVIKAPTDGTITKVHIQAGDSVEKGQILLEL